MSSRACCTGTLHTGTPKGRVETLHSLPTYIAEPPNNAPPIKGIVVVIPDGFGWETPNSRLLADRYAERIGVQCLLPDFMDGKAMDRSVLDSLEQVSDKNAGLASKIIPTLKCATGLGPFMYHNRLSVSQPRIQTFFQSLRQGTSLRVGAAGFCWGGRHVILLAHHDDDDDDDDDDDKGNDNNQNNQEQASKEVSNRNNNEAKPKRLIDAGFAAHPSSVVLPGEIEKMKVPLSICQGTEDFMLNMDGVKVIQGCFEKMNDGSDDHHKKVGGGEDRKSKFEIEVVEGAKHGFAVRGHPEREEEMRQAQIAEDQAVNWFTRWLVG